MTDDRRRITPFRLRSFVLRPIYEVDWPTLWLDGSVLMLTARTFQQQFQRVGQHGQQYL